MQVSMNQQIVQSLRHLTTESDVRVRYGAGEETDKFLASVEPGKQLWYFKTAPDTWQNVPRKGLEGFAIIDGERVVDMLLLAIS
jgi:hypothetical protein